MEMNHILVVEDDKEIREGVKTVSYTHLSIAVVCLFSFFLSRRLLI